MDDNYMVYSEDDGFIDSVNTMPRAIEVAKEFVQSTGRTNVVIYKKVAIPVVDFKVV